VRVRILDEILTKIVRQRDVSTGTFLNMAEERRAVHAYLSIESHQVWHRVAEEAGVSLSGLLEALASEMGEDASSDPRWSARVREARKIDAQRRRRAAA
jgi:hypothetical protein